MKHVPQEIRGRREDRVPSAPAAACATKSTRVSNHRFTGNIRPSLRNGFTAYFVLSLVTGLFCHHHSQGLSRDLSASVGAPGPHAFAVRISIARLATPPRPPHPAPNVRDDREAPLLWERDGANITTDLGF
jgi:hypothetical protein